MKKQKKKHLLHLLNLKKQGAFFSFLRSEERRVGKECRL